MATFGYTTGGASNYSGFTSSPAQALTSYTYTATSGDTITSFSVYGRSTGDAEATAYTMSSGDPANSVSAGNSISVGSDLAWYSTGVLSLALTNEVTYVVAVDPYISDSARIHYDDTGTGSSRVTGTTPHSLTDPFNTPSSANYTYSCYATYTEGGGGGSPSSSVSPSVSPSSSVSPSVSPSASVSPSSSVSPSVSPSASVSPSSSSSPSISPSASVSPSSSVSPSVSPSSSISPSDEDITTGSTTWGHDTDVLETNIRDFSGNWTGDGTINLTGDDEVIVLEADQSMTSEVVKTNAGNFEILQNHYKTGDTVLLEYRHADTEVDCLSATWNTYTTPFNSLGYVQIRITSTL